MKQVDVRSAQARCRNVKENARETRFINRKKISLVIGNFPLELCC